MPYDGNGNYTLPPVYKATPGTEILTTQHNGPLEDIQSALNAVLLRNGSAPITANWNMGSNRIIFLADGVADADAANVGQLKKYLALSSTSLQTVTGPITFSGETLVPSVVDWATKRAIPASDADGRYVRGIGNQDTDQRAVSLAKNKSSGGVFVAFDDGSNQRLQPYGDYATNAQAKEAVDAEAAARANADAALSNSKANLSGGNTFTGQQVFNGNVVTAETSHFETYDQAGGEASAVFGAYDAGTGNENVEAYVNIINSTRTQVQQFSLMGDGKIASSSLGLVAFASQLPFADTAQKVQVFVTAVVGVGAVVKFPTAFSTVPVVIAQVIQANTAATWNNSNISNITATGFTYQGHDPVSLNVMAVGHL